MTTAFAANDFRPGHSESSVCVAGDGAWYRVEVGRPTATRLEFMVGCVEGSVARGASIDTLVRVVFVVLASERRFGAFLTEHTELLFIEHRLPLIIASLVGVRHIGFVGGAEERADEWDRRHRLEDCNSGERCDGPVWGG